MPLSTLDTPREFDLSINASQSLFKNRRILKAAAICLSLLALLATGNCLQAQDQRSAANQETEESQETPQVDAKIQARYDAFAKMMNGTKLVGSFTVVGQDLGKLTAEEYHIKSVKKMPSGDLWVFTARIKYANNDYSIPIPLQVKWAGDDTPVVTLTDFSFFGVGPFSARVVFYNNKYAGTWSHGDVGGHLFGTIKAGEAEGVDVEKSQRELEAKQKEKSSGSSDKKAAQSDGSDRK